MDANIFMPIFMMINVMEKLHICSIKWTLICDAPAVTRVTMVILNKKYRPAHSNVWPNLFSHHNLAHQNAENV